MIKQTQTKLFDFSDTDLDFCAGSKALFPSVFKKVLANGYNAKTVSSVSVSGSNVTLTYGVNHGYVADRVLQVTATGGYSKEVYIDSVTTNTVTFTESTTTGLSGTISTKVASLGWTLAYESGLVQLYKMKYLDERDLYVRFVFAAAGARKNVLNVCVGKTANESTGVITDANAFDAHKSNTDVIVGFEWMFNHVTTTTTDSYNYSQGFSTHGKGLIVGSKYHLVIMSNVANSQFFGRVNAIVPTACMNYAKLDYPIVIGLYSTIAMTGTSSNEIPQFYDNSNGASAYIGSIPVSFDHSNSLQGQMSGSTQAISSFYPSSLDNFNTTAAFPIPLFEKTTRQYLGNVSGGLYRNEILYQDITLNISNIPTLTTDIDFSNYVAQHITFTSTSNSYIHGFVAPVEEMKIA
ncbi:hypothetical protein [uncultured Acinetobacter sp.]|uniref:hypothetical protein n=1 Tax=uncultured Acinetobacter sp. TaxID=165433 RepID=UPI00258BCDA8|nr:hypothetical protein [uncultured Acinetobacter sp.]